MGEAVEGAIDWARRFDFMQQHSGEHIVSGILCGIFHCDNVGFHIGHDLVKLGDPGVLPGDDVEAVQRPGPGGHLNTHALPELLAGEELHQPHLSAAEHMGAIVSGILCGIFHCDNVGFHIGHDLVTIDFNAGLTAEDVLDIERRHMGAAAGAAVRPGPGDDADLSGEGLFAPVIQLFQLLGGRVGHGEGVVQLCGAVQNAAGGRCAVFAGGEGAFQYAVSAPEGDLRFSGPSAIRSLR